MKKRKDQLRKRFFTYSSCSRHLLSLPTFILVSFSCPINLRSSVSDLHSRRRQLHFLRFTLLLSFTRHRRGRYLAALRLDRELQSFFIHSQASRTTTSASTSPLTPSLFVYFESISFCFCLADVAEMRQRFNGAK